MIFAYKSCILNGFLGQFSDVGFCAYYTDVIWICSCALICKCNVLADEHSYTNARHVETVEESLNVVVNLHPLSLPFPFQYALSHSCHNTVMPPLDLVKGVCEFCIVCAELWRPFFSVIGRDIVSPTRCYAPGLFDGRRGGATAIWSWCRSVLALSDARILCRLAYQFLVFAIALGGS